MSSVYLQFAEFSKISSDPTLLEDFKAAVIDAVQKHGAVLMLERQMIAGPNFRRWLRSDNGASLRKLIVDGKIQAVMMDGADLGEGFRHFTFLQFARWFNGERSRDVVLAAEEDATVSKPNKNSLWVNYAGVWSKHDMRPYQTIGEQTREELVFLDKNAVKVNVDATGRDISFRERIVDSLDNPIWIEKFGAHFADIGVITKAVYDNCKDSFGIIRVTPFRPADKMNIHRRFELLCYPAELPKALRIELLQQIVHWGEATLSQVVTGLIGVPALLAPAQSAAWKDFAPPEEPFLPGQTWQGRDAAGRKGAEPS